MLLGEPLEEFLARWERKRDADAEALTECHAGTDLYGVTEFVSARMA